MHSSLRATTSPAILLREIAAASDARLSSPADAECVPNSNIAIAMNTTVAATARRAARREKSRTRA